MNLIEFEIIEIIEKPKQIITDDICCWETTAIVNCYGHKQKRVFRSTSKKEISKYCKGYTFME